MLRMFLNCLQLWELRKMTFLLFGGKKGFSSTLKFKFWNPNSVMNIKMKQPNAIKLAERQKKNSNEEILKDFNCNWLIALIKVDLKVVFLNECLFCEWRIFEKSGLEFSQHWLKKYFKGSFKCKTNKNLSIKMCLRYFCLFSNGNGNEFIC